MSGSLPGYVTNTQPIPGYVTNDQLIPGYVTNNQGLSFGSNITTGGPDSLQSSYVGDVMLVPYRAIGTIVPNVMIEELNRDELEITQHPVERGSPITDHSYKRPMEVILRVAWSNSGQYPGYIHDVYAALLTLQGLRSPFKVATGKRVYNNMLVAALVQTSNADAGDYSLMIQAMLREIIIVGTQGVTVPASALSSKMKTDALPGPRAVQPISVLPSVNDVLNTQTDPFNNISRYQLQGVGITVPPVTLGGA